MERILAEIPVLDISASPEGAVAPELTERLGEVCREFGFFILTGHGVPDETTLRAFAVSRAFFSLPVEVKEAHHPNDGTFLGYRGVNRLRASTSASADSTPPDLKEIFAIGAVQQDGVRQAPGQLLPDDMWPQQVDGFRDALVCYHAHLQQLCVRIARLFAAALKVREDCFVSPGDAPGSALVTINYPEASGGAIAGQMRFAPHRDRNLFTVLSTSGPVLEIQDTNGTWREIPVVPGGFLVNLGTMSSVWTRGEWIAAMHRVTAASSSASLKRQSLVFFFSPDYTRVIRPIKVTGTGGDADAWASAGGPITVADHLRSCWELHR
jgi:isopenicillin N synthase-like dioxygenase